MKYTIAFHSNDLNARGTCVALFDYANYNEKLLNNESIIVCKKDTAHDEKVFRKFYKRFKVFQYSDLKDLHNTLVQEGVNAFYIIKYGKNDGIFFDDIPTLVHCVFDMSEPHGHVYAAVSKTLANKYNSSLFVPHMVSLKPDNSCNMRQTLGIPDYARVFGRYGGRDTFNLKFVMEAIEFIISKYKDVYFLFAGTEPFANMDRQLIFLKHSIVDVDEKNRFINTCDAGLEAGTLGHTFGLAQAEFSVNNKPMIVYNSPELWNRAHLEIMKDKALYFSNKEEFIKTIESFNTNDVINKDWNCYKEYTPSIVMRKFEEVFLG